MITLKKRQIFTDVEYAMRKWKTKREELSDTLDAIAPRDEIAAMIEPYRYEDHCI